MSEPLTKDFVLGMAFGVALAGLSVVAYVAGMWIWIWLAKAGP